MKLPRWPAFFLALAALVALLSVGFAATNSAPSKNPFNFPAAIPVAPAKASPAPTPAPPAASAKSLPYHFAWPAPIPGLRDGADIAAWIQDTGTGDPHSGLFGCVRDDMHRFHEGIDIKCLARDRKGVPLDHVVAVLDGRVAYINTKPGTSGYGNYVVLEHTSADLPFYTLYAHLASIAPGLKVGQSVAAGDELGVLGHSGTEGIPLERAHLHFEVGLRLTDNFQPWYDSKKFGTPNEHGLYNGYNLIGADPMVFFDAIRSGQLKHFADYFRKLPTAFTLRVSSTHVPDFVTRYPALLAKPLPLGNVVAGFDIAFTWYGLPQLVTPLPPGTPGCDKPGLVSLVHYDRAQFSAACQCRETLEFKSATAPPTIGKYLDDEIKMMFGFK